MRIIGAGLLVAAFFANAALSQDPQSPGPGALAELDSATAPREFAPEETAFLQSWLRQVAPECPVEVGRDVARSFLEELSLSQPGKYRVLLTDKFPALQLEPMLLRHAGIQITNPEFAGQRAKIAERRVKLLLDMSGEPATDAARVIAEIRDGSSYQYRRLVEGKIDDDDLIVLLRKTTRPAAAPAAPAPPKVETGADIVAEFARRNQAGAAMLRLQAYVVEGDMTDPGGQKGQIIVAKMRPDRVRITLMKDGIARQVLGGFGGRFWRQTPGQPPQFGSGDESGELRYAAEFADPLLAGDGYAFERLADGEENGIGFYRIQVRRADGSTYVARIEHATYRQVGREFPNKSFAHYSDFRDVDGVTFAFREEQVDPQGRTTTVDLTHITPNPGLIGYYFAPQREPVGDYYALERFIGARGASQGVTR